VCLGLYGVPDYIAYASLPPELMHVLPEGLAKHTIKQMGSSMSAQDVDVMNARIEHLSHEHPRLKTFITGQPLSLMMHLEASHYLTAIRLLPIVLRGLKSFFFLCRDKMGKNQNKG